MAEDFYKTLGVARDASQADIQRAYRELARKYHPDLNPDDKTAKEKFQKVQAAFDVLNDPSKREMYDRYGSSFESVGAGAGPRGGATWSGGAAPGFEDIDFSQFFGERFSGGDPAGGFGDIFTQFRNAQSGSRGRRQRPRAEDIRSEITIPLATSVQGGEAQVLLQRGGAAPETIAVKIPAGVADGAKIRLRGQGEPDSAGGPPGDLLLTVHVAPHPHFQRRGNDLHVRLPVTLAEAVLGAKVDVPTPYGTISLRVPAGTSSGRKLRIKEHGIKPKNGPAGNLFAEVQIVLPERLDDATIEAIKRLPEQVNPRIDLRW